MELGEGLADPDAEGPEVLGTELRVLDPPGILGAAGLGGLAGAREVEGLADLPADGPPGQAAMVGPEGQVLDVLLAATIGLQPDRGDHAGSTRAPGRSGSPGAARRRK